MHKIKSFDGFWFCIANIKRYAEEERNGPKIERRFYKQNNLSFGYSQRSVELIYQ
jgi:hypothetical protein